MIALQLKQIFLEAFEQNTDELKRLCDSLEQNEREELQDLEKQLEVSLLLKEITKLEYNVVSHAFLLYLFLSS